MKIIYVKRGTKERGFKIIRLRLRNNNRLINASTVMKNLSEEKCDELLKTGYKNKNK